MTAKDHLPASPPALGPTERLPALGGLPPWGRQVLLLSAGGLLVDGVLHGLQGGGAWLGLGALAGGWIWMAKGQLSRSLPLRPKTVESWNERCQALLSQFDQLDPNPQQADGRAAALADLLKQKARQELRVALVSSIPPEPTHLPAFQAALRGPWPLQLLVSEPLPSSSSRWRWSDAFASCDALIFHLRPPLIAADLRWLDALPVNLPLWLLVEVGAHPAPETCLMDIQSQWPGMNPSRLLVWSGEPDQLSNSLTPIAQWLAHEGAQLPQTTLCRSLEHLHGSWQTDLERLRRVQWRQLQQRTQWLVAAGVLLTPAMSLDLLVLSVANGLMLRDMARLWGCTWTLEQLQAAALQVGKATLALGIVEWSTQAFAAAFKLEGTTWLVGGTLQALSAAYLTRVIGHAMADLMARNVGVSEPDLEAIKAEVPLLVAKAAEAERLQWGAFLQEALSWLRQQNQGGPIQLKAP
ncbi:MAG: DUF697 domain-containing protein [Cyanobacteriota bacterium]